MYTHTPTHTPDKCENLQNQIYWCILPPINIAIGATFLLNTGDEFNNNVEHNSFLVEIIAKVTHSDECGASSNFTWTNKKYRNVLFTNEVCFDFFTSNYCKCLYMVHFKITIICLIYIFLIHKQQCSNKIKYS